MATDSDVARTFESVDWTSYDATGRVITRKTVALVLTVVVSIGVFAYDYFFVPNAHSLVLSVRPEPIDWLALLATIVIVFFGVVPLAANPRLTAHYWRRFRRNRLAVLSLLYLFVFSILALVGPTWWGGPLNAPRMMELDARGGTPLGYPPFWMEIAESNVVYCATEVVAGMCQGTIVHPLGTTPDGRDVLAFVLAGMEVAFKIAVITAAIIIPIATTVGTVAAYYGGRVGGVLMRYVDLQQAIPAFIVYLLVEYLYGPSLLAVIVLFGLFDWGRIARRVRGDAVRHREAGFVVAAKDAGATGLDTIRRHLVPNVANSVLAGLAIQVPFIIIMEATLSFIGVVNSETPSWGFAISVGLESKPPTPSLQAGWAWWSYVFPLLALLLTVVSMSIVGDAVHDAIETRDMGDGR